MKTDPIDEALNKWITPSNVDTYETKISAYSKFIKLKWFFIVASLLLAFITATYALSIGVSYVTFSDALHVVWNHLIGNPGDVSTDKVEYAVYWIKMPTVITGVIAGAGLAAAGAVMQTILRNPLADPYTTGVSSGASFGATLAMGLGITVTAGYAIVINAFIFSLIPMIIIMIVSKARNASPVTMIMSGIAVMYIFNAMTTLIKLFISPEALSSLYAWSVGSIDINGSGVNGWLAVKIMFAFVSIGLIILMSVSRKLNVVATGDEVARTIGVNADNLRIISLLTVSLISAGVVSFTGLIGFIGLVCPHIARIFVGSDNRYLIPASATFGAALLTIADILGKTIMYPTTIQVGVITAFIGGPLFLYLIIKQKKESW